MRVLHFVTAVMVFETMPLPITKYNECLSYQFFLYLSVGLVLINLYFLLLSLCFSRASTNFQILEVLNFLPLKFGGSTENFRKFQFATRFYRNSSIYILLYLDIFNRTFMSLHCFVLIIFIDELDALRQFFLFFFSAFFLFYFIYFFFF